MSWVYGEIGERNCGTCQHKHIFFLLPLTFYTDIMLYVNDINLGCILYAFINGFCGMASIACLTLMAVERYITLCLSQNAKITFHRAQTKLIFGIWLYATIVSTPPLFGWGRYVQDVYPASCTFDFYTHDRNSQTFMIYLLTVGFLLPVIVMSTLYGRIHAKISSYKRLVKRARTSSGSIGWSKLRRFLPTISFRPYDRNLPGENLTLGQSNIDEAETSLNGEKTIDTRYLNDHWEVESRLERAEVQFCKRTLLVILGFLVCWTPYAMLTIACQLEFEAAFSTTASAVTLLLAKASVAINPIIYAFKDKMYRSELNNLIGSLSD